MSGFNDFMDKAGVFAAKAAGKAKDLASVAAEKTKQVSRAAKLNMDISAKRDTIKKAYGELGRLYYEAHGTAPEEPFAQICQEIDLASAAIAGMEEELARLREEMGPDETAQDADFASVVDATAADADVEVEITVDTPEEPAAPAAPEAPPEPEAAAEPVQPETPDGPEFSEEPEQPADEVPRWD